VEYKNKSAASSNRGDWNGLNVIQKISEQHNLKVEHQETVENSDIGKYQCKGKRRVCLSWEISSHALIMTNTEERKHYKA
jgi:hypothetical protein